MDGHWIYAKPLTQPILRIWREDKLEHNIEYVAHTEAIEVVGLLEALDGNQSAQVSALISRAKDWATTLTSKKSSRHLAWINFNCCRWRSIAYLLPALSLSNMFSEDIAKALLQTTLPIMGVERSFPSTMRFSPTTFFDQDFPHPRTENRLSKIAIWMRHSPSNTILGLWFRISYEYLILEINQPGCLFAVDFPKWSFLATECWIKDLWQFVWEHDITLSPPLLATLHIQQINDQYLMPWF
eukprot:3385967-Ditylum_brightwellii.AAC.1